MYRKTTDDEQERPRNAGYRVKGPGGTAKATPADLTWIKQEIQEINSDAGKGIWRRREWADNIRYCRWDGQSEDGLKHEESLGEKPFPFEGASDTRLRLADMVVQERVRVLMAAQKRGMLSVTQVEASDAAKAAQIKKLMKWLMGSKLRKQLRRASKAVANYQEGDSPAVGFMGVFWHREAALENQTVTLEGMQQLIGQLAEAQEIDPADALAALDMIQDPDQEELAARLFQAVAPHLNEKRARQIARDLREKQTADFPVPYVAYDGPRVQAFRLFDDIFVPSNSRDLQAARMILTREWLTEPMLRERIVSHGWSEAFVAGVLKHEGKTSFPSRSDDQVEGDYSAEVRSHRREDAGQYAGLYEVLTAYWRATNDDNIPGIYMLTFHGQCEEAAKAKELLGYRHGKYPFVAFQRETLTDYLWDSRGWPELLMVDQQEQKRQKDARQDHAQLATIPPIKVPWRRGHLGLVIGPMEQIKERRPGEIEWMKPPDEPKSAKEYARDSERYVNQLTGRPDVELAAQEHILAMQDLVDDWLENMTGVLSMVVQLIMQYMPEDEVARVVGEGFEMDRSTKDIQNLYDFELAFDVTSLDMEQMVKKAQLWQQMLLPMDRHATVRTDRLVAWMARSMDPTLADEVIEPVETADQREAADEEMNFVKIKAGIEPQMAEMNENWPLRLQTLERIVQANPNAIEDMSDTSKAMLEARVKHLQFMTQQIQNASTGRVGAEYATGMRG